MADPASKGLVAAQTKGGSRVATKAGGGARPAAAAAAAGEADGDYHPQGLDDRYQTVKGADQLILEPDRTLMIGFVFIAIVLLFHFMGFVWK